jgi:hypothetical protein
MKNLTTESAEHAEKGKYKNQESGFRLQDLSSGVLGLDS